MKQILLACICLFVLAGAAAADDSWSKVQSRSEVVIGFAAHYPPFESKNEKTGEFEGFDVDLANAMAEVMGVKVKFVDAEWQGLLAGLSKGDFDMLMTCMSKSETRGQNVNFSDSYYSLADVMVVGMDNQNIKSSADLQGKTVGVQLGSGSEQAVDAMTGFKEIKRYNYNPEAFLDLKNGRIDALVVGYAYAVNQIKVDPSYKVVGEPLAEAEIVVVMPKGADALTAKVNEALAEVRKNGAYDKAHTTWLKLD